MEIESGERTAGGGSFTTRSQAQVNQLKIIAGVTFAALVLQVYFQGRTASNTGRAADLMAPTPAPSEPGTPAPPAPSPPACGGYSSPTFDGTVKKSSDLMTVHFDEANHAAAWLEVKMEDLTNPDQNHAQFGVTALEQGGSFSHFQTTGGAGFLWLMRMAKDQSAVELLQVDLTLRVSDPHYENVWEEAQYPGIRHVLPIAATKTETKDDKCNTVALVLDASGLVRAGFFAITSWFGSGTAFNPGATPKVNLETAQGFRHNIDFTVVYSTPGALGSAPNEDGARFCIFKLPKKEDVMLGRLADDRAGYFFEEFTSLGDFSGEDYAGKDSRTLYNPKIKLINRMNAHNSHCADEFGRAKNKLHFYIDPSTPAALLEPTRKGIEMWGPAFEAVGSGVEAHWKSDDLANPGNWPSNYDNADICFNTISWATGGDGTFAIGQSVKDPRTGEVLKANIIFTLGWLQIWMGRRIVYGATRASSSLRQDLRFLTEASGPNTDDTMYWDEHPRNATVPEELRDRSPHLFALLTKPTDAESLKFLQAGIQDVTAHELGHVIGLRHNFRGSASISFEDCQRKSKVEANGLTASVMDYLGFNMISEKTRAELKTKFPDAGEIPDADKAFYFTPVIGAYDFWVVKYGYTKFSEETHEACPRGWCSGKDGLWAIADEYNTASFSFGTDETRDDFDPYSVLRDLGSDPIVYFEDQYQVAVEGMAAMFDRTMADDLPTTALYYPYRVFMGGIHSGAGRLARFVGGVEALRKRGGTAGCDPDCSNRPVTVENQDRALGLVLDSVTEAKYEPPAWYFKDAVQVLADYSALYGQAPINVREDLNKRKKATLTALLADERLTLVRLSEAHLQKKDGERLQWLLNTCTDGLFPNHGDETGEPLASHLRDSTRLHDVRAHYATLLKGYVGSDPIIAASMAAEVARLNAGLAKVVTHLGDGKDATLELQIVKGLMR